jgi:hypothetical protein
MASNRKWREAKRECLGTGIVQTDPRRSKGVEGGRFDRYDLFAFSAVGEVTMEVGSQFSFSDSRTLVLPLANSR